MSAVRLNIRLFFKQSTSKWCPFCVKLVKDSSMLQRYALFFLFLFSTTFSIAQVAQVQFGKNRVQYHNFFDEWSQYESENFITYWYGLTRNVGQSVVQMAEYDFTEIQALLEHRINEKVQIIVYADLSDLKQSNIGNEEVFTNTGGQTKIVGNTVFVYFNGDHTHLRKQIREGVTRVYLDAMLFGSNIQEIVQNAIMLNLPLWFKEGLVSFVGEQWNTELDAQLKNYILSEDFKDFERFSDENPNLAGQSFWFYVSDTYGTSTLTNLLYLTRINRSIESGLLYVLGSSFETVIAEWERYYRARYEEDKKGREQVAGTAIPIKNKKQLPITAAKLSPDGTKFIYVLNKLGKHWVYLYDLSRNEEELIFKGGFKNQFQTIDLNYPLVAWNPNGSEVSIISERRDVISLLTLDIYSKKEESILIPEQYQRIYSLDYLDPFTLVFSAVASGHSDLFTFNARTRQSQRITNDYFDDLDAVAATINGEKGILFASNRIDTLLENRSLDTILPINSFDIYFYNLSRGIPEVVQVTNTPLSNERQPMAVDSAFFSYLSDRQGVYNRETGTLEDFIHHYDQKIYLTDGTDIIMHIDSSLEKLDTSLIDTIEIVPVIRQRAKTFVNSNYAQNIQLQSSSVPTKQVLELVQATLGSKLYLHKMNSMARKTPPLTVFQKSRAIRMESMLSEVEARQNALSEAQTLDSIAQVVGIEGVTEEVVSDPLDFFFQSEFGNPASSPVEEAEEQQQVTTIQSESFMSPFDFIRSGVESRNSHRFKLTNLIPYRLQFRTDYFSTQMDNNLLFEGLDNFAANPDGVFGYPPPGILLKANVKDLLEDHVFEGGIRVPTTFNGAEYFVTYTDRKKRLDKEYAVYMKRQRINEGAIGFVPRRKENIILLGQFGVRYPLDIFQSLRARATLRSDRLQQLVTDRQSSGVPNETATRAGIRLEYVYDNTMEKDLNVFHGTRIKVFGEVFKKFNLSSSGGLDLNFSNGAMTIFSIDARHYQPVLKHAVFATRFAANTSFGSERIQYFLGGSDNWLLPQYNEDIPTTQNNYAFQTAAPNVRGFRFGIRNGNSYALLNSELRVPLFKYFSRRVNSGFLRNFQLVGFFDVGTAWEGSDPYAEDNPLNTTVFQEGDVIDITVNYFRDPIVASYGVGARSMLFGYFIRLDYGWGIETKVVQDPRLHISLGLDF